MLLSSISPTLVGNGLYTNYTGLKSVAPEKMSLKSTILCYIYKLVKSLLCKSHHCGKLIWFTSIQFIFLILKVCLVLFVNLLSSKMLKC